MTAITKEYKENQMKRMQECIDMAEELCEQRGRPCGFGRDAVAQMAMVFYKEQVESVSLAFMFGHELIDINTGLPGRCVKQPDYGL
jgi:hypothetical protein